MRCVRESIAWLVCAGALAAQAPQQPVFRSGVRLVTLNVTVVGGDGRPVGNLQAADFDVRVDGVRRTVQTLDFLEFGAREFESRAGAAAASAPTAIAPSVSRGARTFLLLFDDLSFTPLEGKGLTAAAERMLADLDAADLVGLTTTSALGAVVEPTRDRAAIRAAIATLAGRNTETADPFFIGVHEAVALFDSVGSEEYAEALFDRECKEVNLGPSCGDLVESMAFRLAAQARRRLEDQLAALERALRVMSLAPAPRAVVMLSRGTSVASAPDLPAAMDALSSAAAAAGVQVYALTDFGDEVDLRDRTFERSRARHAEAGVLTQGLQTITRAAGGETFRVVGTADRFFDRILRETSAFYELGIELPSDVDLSAPLRAEVSVRRGGMTVRSAKRAIDRQPTLSRDQAIAQRLAQGGASFGVPLEVGTAIRSYTGAGVQVVVDARVPGDAALPIGFRFGLVDADGRMAFAAQKDIAAPASGNHQVVVALPVTPGSYRLRVVVADGPGAIGSVERPIQAELASSGDLKLSDLLMTTAVAGGAEQFSAIGDIPAAAERLTAVLELHPRGAMPAGVTVRFALRAADESPIVPDQSPRPSIAGDRWTAAATFSVAQIPPGRCLLRADVLEAGKIIGTQSRTLRRR